MSIKDGGHTPGPWIVSHDPDGTSDDYCIGVPDGKVDQVAVCSNRDAALIAAAPDMYEALKVARECILNRSNVEYRKHGESTPLQDHYEELIAQIDAAMEKAETP